MSEVTAQPITTPARRRPGRNNARAGGQKAYASENDAAAGAGVTYGPRYHGTPQTPDKSAAASGASAANAASQQRSKNKPKAKSHQHSSPEAGHQTPPQHAVPIKPGTAAAYAGATFHASPAPSALPMPSFLAKSSSESPAQRRSMNIAQEPSPPATDTDIPTPFRPSSVPKPQESPLDFMFRAHREEQQRQGSVDHRPYVLGTTSPPTLSPFDTRSSPRATSMPQARRPDMRRSTSGIDSAELDGTPGRPIGPAFSTPYQERMKAAQNKPSRASQSQSQSQTPRHQPAAQDPTDALKRFLFSNTAASAPVLGSTNNTRPQVSSPPAHHPASSPMRNDGPAQSRPGNIQAMENDLRRILKLDMAPGSTNSDSGLFSQ